MESAGSSHKHDLADGWTVELKGDPDDLEDWKAELRPPNLPYVVLTDVSVSPEVEQNAYLLSASEFQTCGDAADVREQAIPMLRELNGLLSVARDTRPVVLGRIFRRDLSGIYHGTAFLDAIMTGPRFRLSAYMTVIRQGKEVFDEPALSFAQSAWALKDGILAAALEHFGRADNWHDLYKTYEALGNKEEFLKLGFTRREVANFSLTAQLIRHHKTTSLPARQLSLAEGREFIADAIRRRLAAGNSRHSS
ncbi:hypothetical protein [Mesorhizobium sp. 1M-11]|uniref:hypothetical protein n=1 Tax=Mesorhizobium sp. 1M-11 TaxID=1529006 RepID=UPI0006C75B74|nr:hypothetical protein [Mesorhizobium sp. 1M-11]